MLTTPTSMADKPGPPRTRVTGSQFIPKEDLLGYFLILPMLSVLALLIFVPLLSVIWDSLHDRTFLSNSYRFIGLDNYQTLFSSAAFWVIVGRSLIWTLSSVVLQIAAGLIMALFLNQA